MDIENYYAKMGLEYDPFLKNSKEYFVDTQESKEVISRLEYLQQIKGIGLLTGEPGMGKTTCIRRWASRMNPSLYKVVYTSLSTLTVMEFYRNLALELGVESSHRKVENYHRIQQEVEHLVVEKRVTPVIIIDEADHLSGKMLQDLKILFNFEMDSRDKCIVLLTGLYTICNTLRLSAYEPLRQRIVMSYNMGNLTDEDGRNYILSKVKYAGGTGMIFEDAAMEALLSASNGVPRILNKLCSTSLLIAGSTNCQSVTPDVVMSAVDDNRLG